MGLPLFKYSAESTGGASTSPEREGHAVCAEYRIGHIDRIPLGDFGGVIAARYDEPEGGFLHIGYRRGTRGVLDTREVKRFWGRIYLWARPK